MIMEGDKENGKKEAVLAKDAPLSEEEGAQMLFSADHDLSSRLGDGQTMLGTF